MFTKLFSFLLLCTIVAPHMENKFETGALYDGDNMQDFLDLCREKNQSLDDPILEEQKCSHITLAMEKIENLEERKAETELMWKHLRETQKIFFKFKTRLLSWEYHISNALLGVALVLGLYLCLIRHFDIRKIYDPYLHDPTKGIPSWQYVRMEYIATRITVKHKVPVPDSEDEEEEEGQKNENQLEAEGEGILDTNINLEEQKEEFRQEDPAEKSVIDLPSKILNAKSASLKMGE